MFWHPYAKLTAQIQLWNHPPGKKSCLSAEKIDMLRQSVLRVACMANLLTLSCPCNHQVYLFTEAENIFFFSLTFLVFNGSVLKKVIYKLLAYHNTLKSRFHPLQLLQFFTDVRSDSALTQMFASPSPEWIYCSLYLHILLTQIQYSKFKLM